MSNTLSSAQLSAPSACTFSFTGAYVQCLLHEQSASSAINLRPGTYKISRTISISRSATIASSAPPAAVILDASGMSKPGPIMNFSTAWSMGPSALSLEVSHLSFLNGHSQLGGGLFARNIGMLSVTNCEFINTHYNCSAETYCHESLPYVGGALYIQNVPSVDIKGGGFYNNAFYNLWGTKTSIQPAGGGCFLNYDQTVDGISVTVQGTSFIANELRAGCTMTSVAPALLFQGVSAPDNDNTYGQSLCINMSNISVHIDIEAADNKNLVATAPGQETDITCTGYAIAGAVWVRTKCNVDTAEFEIRGHFDSNVAQSAAPAAGAVALSFADYEHCPTPCNVSDGGNGFTMCPVEPAKTARVNWIVGGTFTNNVCLSTKLDGQNFISTGGALELSNSGSMFDISGLIEGEFINNSAVGAQVYGGAIYAYYNSPAAPLAPRDLATLKQLENKTFAHEPPGTGGKALPAFGKPIRVNLTTTVSNSIFVNNKVAPSAALLSLPANGNVQQAPMDSSLSSAQTCSNNAAIRGGSGTSLGASALATAVGGAGGAIALLQLGPNDPVLSKDPTAGGKAYKELGVKEGFVEYYHNISWKINNASLDSNRAICSCPGGGISFTGVALTVQNSNITNNSAGSKGGGVYATKGSGNLTIINSSLDKNSISKVYSKINSLNFTKAIAAATTSRGNDGDGLDHRCASFDSDEMGTVSLVPGDQLGFDSSGGLALDGMNFSFQGASLLDDGGTRVELTAPVAGKLIVTPTTRGTCPPGNKLVMTFSSFAFYEPYPFSNPMGTSFGSINCQVCQAGTYSLETSSFAGTAVVSPIKCLRCPAGGNCLRGGSDVRPSPNLWGYVSNASTIREIIFVNCPDGYCCPLGGDCPTYDYCAGNRSGVLCGQCKPGYCSLVYGKSCVECSTCIIGNTASSAQYGIFAASTIIYILIVALALYVLRIVYSTTDGASPWGLYSMVLFFYQNLSFVLVANDSGFVSTILSLFNLNFEMSGGGRSFSSSSGTGLLAKICNPLDRDTAANIALSAFFPITVFMLFFIYWFIHPRIKTKCWDSGLQRIKILCWGDTASFVDAEAVAEVLGFSSSSVADARAVSDQNPTKSVELQNVHLDQPLGVEVGDGTADYIQMHDGDHTKGEQEKQTGRDETPIEGDSVLPSPVESRASSNLRKKRNILLGKVRKLKNRCSRADRRMDRALTFMSRCCRFEEGYSMQRSGQNSRMFLADVSRMSSRQNSSDLSDWTENSDLDSRKRRPTLSEHWRVANATMPSGEADRVGKEHVQLAQLVQSRNESSEGEKRRVLFQIDPFPILAYKLTMFLFNSVATTAFSAVHCVRIGPYLHLRIDGNVQCWTSTVWWQWLALIIVICIVVPFPFYLILVRNRLRSSCNEQNVVTVQTQLNALEGAFQARQLHFESWIFAHRLAILFFFEFVQSFYIKSLMVAFGFVLIAIHTMWKRPYKIPMAQDLANMLSISLAILAMLNIRTTDTANSYVYARIVIQAVVIVIATVCIAAAFALIQFGRQAVLERFPDLADYYFTEHELKMKKTEINTHL